MVKEISRAEKKSYISGAIDISNEFAELSPEILGIMKNFKVQTDKIIKLIKELDSLT